MIENVALGDVVTAHYFDSEYGSMPSDASGEVMVEDGRLVVGGTAIIPSDVWSVHRGPCDHPSDPRSDAARDNFRRKYA